MSKPPILMRREGSHLVPLTPWSEEQVLDLPDDRDLAVRVTKATSTGKDANEGLLALWWAGINLLHENVGDPDHEWPTPRHLSKKILSDIGFCIQVPDGQGGTRTLASSIALQNLEDFEDRQMIFELAQAYVVARWRWNPWQSWKDERDLDRRQRGSR